MYAAHQKGTYPLLLVSKFSAIVAGHRGRIAELWRKNKQTDVGVEAVRRCVSK